MPSWTWGVVASTAVLSIALLAQSIPDVTGRWYAVEPKALKGHELQITRDDAVLQLEELRSMSAEVYDSFGRRVGHRKGERERTAYRLDGKRTVVRGIHSWLRSGPDHVLLSDLYQATGLRVERKLSLDDRGRLVLEHLHPPVTGEDSASASSQILAHTRVVFEKR